MTAPPPEPPADPGTPTDPGPDLRRAMEATPALLWVSDTTGRFCYVNQSWLDFTGRPLADELGEGWTDSVHPTDRERRLLAHQEAIATQRPFDLTYRLRRHDGVYRWVHDRGAPIIDDGHLVGYAGSGVDVTTQRLALSSLARETQLADLVFEAARIGAWSWRPETDEVQWSPELEALFDLAPGTFEGDLGSFMKRVHSDDREPTALTLSDAVTQSEPFTLEYRVPLAGGDIRWLEARGCPLIEPTGEIHEWIGVAIDVSERREDEIQREASLRATLRAKSRAEQANDALRRAVKRLDTVLHRQEEAAEILQQALLPLEMPDIEGIAICATYLPGATGQAGSSVVGGDWYDVSLDDAGRPSFVIGDVAGHGLGAAVSMARLRYACQLCLQEGAAPAEVLDRMNRFIVGGPQWEMATACAATLDLSTRTLAVARAGHPPPVLWHPDGTCEFVGANNGRPLGVRGAPALVEWRQELRPGSLLVLYTDGLIERRGESIDVGLDRLSDAVTTHAPTTELTDVCEVLLGALFVDAERRDDVAILAIRVD